MPGSTAVELGTIDHSVARSRVPIPAGPIFISSFEHILGWTTPSCCSSPPPPPPRLRKLFTFEDRMSNAVEQIQHQENTRQ